MKLNLILILLPMTCWACSEEAADVQTNNDPDRTELPLVYEKIYGASEVYIEDDFVVIRTQGTPDHVSPYYQNTEWEENLYAAYDGENPAFHLNPNRIDAYDFVYRIPLTPTKASTPQPTALGSIGFALNGVALFNQYAGPNNQPLTDEINSFDQYNGHPQQQGVYHYHIEPLHLTDMIGEEGLMGFLLDGYPVYGPVENGQQVQNSDLDEYHGHEHATEDYPEGTYHYHITDTDPYINGNGYYGNPGTLSQ